MIDTLQRMDEVDVNRLSEKEIRMLQMFHYSVWLHAEEDNGRDTLYMKLMQIKNSPVLLADIIDEPVNIGFDCPLDLHCTYTRDKILVAMNYMKPSTIREGVKYLPEKKIDLFFITLNKSDKDYSPTTLYNDYSINETLFHWQSQSTTSEASTTGK